MTTPKKNINQERMTYELAKQLNEMGYPEPLYLSINSVTRDLSAAFSRSSPSLPRAPENINGETR